MNQSERRLYLIRSLLDENPETRGWAFRGAQPIRSGCCVGC